MQRLREIRYLLIDMDGVLYRGDMPLPGLTDFFAFLKEHQIRYQLVTNNASRTPEQYVRKLAGMGVQVEPEAILTSARATAYALREEYPPGTRVYAIGGEGLIAALQEVGFVLSSDRASVVVVGWDDDLTFAKLRHACLLIRAGARFVGTNPDRTLPTPEGEIPGNGSILAALETATGIKPEIIGKPEPPLLRQAMERIQADPAATAMLGDRPETDVLAGERLGLLTILVLSGATSREDLEHADPQPDLVFEHIGALTRHWDALLSG